VFLIAFIIKFLASCAILGGKYAKDWGYFSFSVLEVTQHYFLDFMPICYMLCCHRKAYEAHALMRIGQDCLQEEAGRQDPSAFVSSQFMDQLTYSQRG